jgi:nicotinamidase-related amidase
METNMQNAALLVIDVQKGLDSPKLGERNNSDAEANMEALLTHWRNKSGTVIHVKHNSTESGSTLRPELPGNEIKDCVKPLSNEVLFEKTVNSAFIGTDLEAHLHSKQISELVIIGLTHDLCVSTAVRMAANLGFKGWLPSYSPATFERKGFDGAYITADQMHSINLASLHGEFCTVISTQQALA